MASGATATYFFPYPLQTDPVDVASDVEDLATAIDTQFTLTAPLLSPEFTGVPLSVTPNPSDNSTKIATTAYVKAQSYLTTSTAASTYAPIASPTFTGVPVAPTASVGTDTTQIATTAFVNAEISNDAILKTGGTMTGTLVLIASSASVPSIRIPHGTAPSSPTDGDIWTTTVGMYARINGNTIGPFGTGANWQSAAPSPAITGMLWVDSDTDVLQVYNGSAWYSPMGIERNQASLSANNYTLVLTDRSKLVEMDNGSTANTLTIPLNSSVAFPIGTQITILQTNSGQTTLTATGGVTLNGTPGLKLRAQWSSATLIKRGTDTWVAIGDLSA